MAEGMGNRKWGDIASLSDSCLGSLWDIVGKTMRGEDLDLNLTSATCWRLSKSL